MDEPLSDKPDTLPMKYYKISTEFFMKLCFEGLGMHCAAGMPFGSTIVHMWCPPGGQDVYVYFMHESFPRVKTTEVGEWILSFMPTKMVPEPPAIITP